MSASGSGRGRPSNGSAPRTPSNESGPRGDARTPAKTPGSNSHGNGRKPRFPEHLKAHEISQGLKRGELYQGLVRVNPRRRREAFVVVKQFANDVLLDGDVAQNRAMDGDTVAIRLLPKARWKRLGRPGEAAGHAAAAEDEDACHAEAGNGSGGEGDEAESLQALAAAGPPQLDPHEDELYQKAAIVVGIIRRNEFDRHVGVLKPCDPKGVIRPQDKFVFFIPNNTRAPRFLIPLQACPHDFAGDPAKYASTFFSCTLDGWPVHAFWPRGRLGPHKLGEAGEIEAETEALLMEHDIDARPFSDDVKACLPPTPWSIPPEEIARRRDLRASCIFTIDPLTARDLDDALSCTPLPDGTFEVGVHIADVSHFVQPRTALDAEARRRGTTTYLVQRAVPMLPGLLCEELCSLNPGVDRLAFSVIWRLDAEGRRLDEWFGRTVIRSCCKLDYGRAQRLIEEEGWECDAPVHCGYGPRDVARCTRDLHRLSLRMRRARFDAGALSLHTVRLCFSLAADGTPVECFEYELKDSNRLVEEFMLLANMSVAERIAAAFPAAALLRRHPPPLLRRLDDFLDFCAQHSVPFDAGSAGAIHASLRRLEAEFAPDVAAAIRSLLTKPMQTAKYFCTGDFEEAAHWGHFALAVPFYTHFTSPIRRYADVIVHRLLDAALRSGAVQELEPAAAVRRAREIEAGLPDQAELSQIADHCNTRKLKAKQAQEHSGLVHLCLMLRHRPLVEPAVVVLVQDRSFDVFVSRLGIEKRITLQDLEPLIERHEHSPADRALTLHWRPDAAAAAGAPSTTVRVFGRVKVRCGMKPNRVPIDILLEFLPGDPAADARVADVTAAASCIRLTRAEGLDE